MFVVFVQVTVVQICAQQLHPLLVKLELGPLIHVGRVITIICTPLESIFPAFVIPRGMYDTTSTWRFGFGCAIHGRRSATEVLTYGRTFH